MKRITGGFLLALLLAAPLAAQQPQPKAAAQDEFVPVSQPLSPQDTIPAPRLVATAYGFIWVLLLGYVWSVRSRLTKVEREMATLSQRVSAGDRTR